MCQRMQRLVEARRIGQSLMLEDLQHCSLFQRHWRATRCLGVRGGTSSNISFRRVTDESVNRWIGKGTYLSQKVLQWLKRDITKGAKMSRGLTAGKERKTHVQRRLGRLHSSVGTQEKCLCVSTKRYIHKSQSQKSTQMPVDI